MLSRSKNKKSVQTSLNTLARVYCSHNWKLQEFGQDPGSGSFYFWRLCSVLWFPPQPGFLTVSNEYQPILGSSCFLFVLRRRQGERPKLCTDWITPELLPERVSFLVTGHSWSVTFPVPTCGGDVGVQPLCSASTSPPPSRQNSYSKPGAVEACVQPHNSSSVCLPPLRPPTSTQDWLTRAPATGVPRIPNSAA